MTIKQQGGIFGRNPTFNDVEVEGTLTVNGEPISDFGTMAQQDANSVNIDGGAIDGVTLGTNSVVTDARIDNVKIDGNAITTTNTDGDLLITPDGAGSVGVGPHATNPSQAVFCVGKKTQAIQAFFGVNDNALTDPYIQVQGRNTANSSAYSANFGVHADNQTAFIGLNGGTDVEFTSAGNVKVSSGSGIDFSATSGTGTSELFDDYEEGTWTPVLSDATSGGNTATLGSSTAHYVKVGSVVHLFLQVINVNNSGMTGGNTLYIQGLPYTSVSSNNSAGSAVFDRVSVSGFDAVTPAIGPTRDYMTLGTTTTGAADGNLTVAAFNNSSSDIQNLTISYRA